MQSLTKFALLVLLYPAATLAMNCKGCTPLDMLTFDKMVNAFPVSLVKFDTAYPYGEKHDEYAKISEEAAELPNMFIGEVGIKDYGDKDNAELGERFKVVKDDYPVVMMFVQKEGQEREEFKFVGEFKNENLKSFIRQNTGIYLPLAGCIEEFDHMADKIVNGGDVAKVLKEAEDALAKIKGGEAKNKRRAETYVKIMKKIKADGIAFVPKETERTKKMMDGKISDAKKKELQEKINVLRSFTKQDDSGAKAKEEL